MASLLPPTPDEDESGPLAFAGATGRGVRVAVIDSGVNSAHPHISAVAGGVTITAAGEVDASDYTDRIGHGTAVLAAIQEKVPAAEFFAVKVFHSALRTNAANLVRALEWCIGERMDVVNLSLGTTNPAHQERFRQAVAEARRTLLVAAREVGGQPCYPGCLPGVFSVDVDWACPRNRFDCRGSRENIVFSASGYPRPIPGVPRDRNLRGMSFAVANMTAFVARACETGEGKQTENDRFRSIRERLASECARYCL